MWKRCRSFGNFLGNDAYIRLHVSVQSNLVCEVWYNNFVSAINDRTDAESQRKRLWKVPFGLHEEQ